MDNIFSDYRINKKVSRKGVDKLIAEIKSMNFETAAMSFTPSGANEILEDWKIKRTKKGKIKFRSKNGNKRVKTQILNLLSFFPVVGFVLVCFTKQKYKQEFIKELWGYRIIRNGSKTTLEKIDHEELYKYCTTDFASGKSIPIQEEVVYCGPNGKICGWDMV